MTHAPGRPPLAVAPAGRLLRALLVSLLCVLSCAAHAAPTRVVDVGSAAAQDSQVLDRAFRVIPDPDASLTAEAVLAGQHDHAALATTRTPMNLGYPRHRYWAVVDLRHDGEQPVERLLVLWRGSAHTSQAYWRSRRPGDAANARGERPMTDLPSRSAVLRLQLAPGEVRRIAIRIDTATALTLDFRLLSDPELARIERRDYAWMGLFTGAKFAIGFYVFALFFATRDRLYLIFAGYALVNITYTLHAEAYAYELWPQDGRWWGNLVNAYSGALFSLFVAQFVRDYLDLKRTQPLMDRRVLVPAMWVFASALLLFPWAPWLANSVAALSAVAAIFLLSGMVVRSIGIERPPTSFLIGILFAFAAGVTHLSRRLGLLPDLEWIALLPQLGAVATLIAFAVALMERVRRLVEEARRSQERYADRLSQEVAERTEQLSAEMRRAEQALHELQGTQSQLVAAEKMASLGQLVAGVAHEINTPIGIAVTAASHMRQTHAGFAAKAQGGKLSRSDLERWSETIDEAGRLILGSLERAHTLIGSFKQVAVDQSSESRRSFALDAFLEEVGFALQPTYKRAGHRLQIDCSPGITLDTYPGALFQVLTNLIGNAVMHGFEDGTVGTMWLEARAEGAALHLRFSDDGRGMSAEVAARAFDPFFTTRRGSGGSGLGLHLVYNLVTQLLGGRIELHSEPGRGTRFEIMLPRVAPAGSPATVLPKQLAENGPDVAP